MKLFDTAIGFPARLIGVGGGQHALCAAMFVFIAGCAQPKCVGGWLELPGGYEPEDLEIVVSEPATEWTSDELRFIGRGDHSLSSDCDVSFDDGYYEFRVVCSHQLESGPVQVVGVTTDLAFYGIGDANIDLNSRALAFPGLTGHIELLDVTTPLD